MAAAAAMDSTDESSNMGPMKGGGALGISKASAKINKSSIKKPPAAPKPVAKIYNADPSDFRRVVQELTGTNREAVGAARTVRDSMPSAPRPSRLQRIAPPPLRPAIPVSRTVQQTPEYVSSMQPSLHGHNHHQQGSIPTSLGTFRHQQAAQNMPSLPMLSPRLFGPLPALTPGDNAWANPLELAAGHSGSATNVLPPQSVTVEGEGRGRSLDAAVAPQSPLFLPSAAAAGPPSLSPRLPWSTAIWSPRFLPSPLPLSPNFLPHLSPSLIPPISPGFFAASGFPSPRTSGFGFGNAYGGLFMNGAQLVDSDHDFSFRGPNGVGANRFS
eukprot:c24676_g1_i2 orf=343-1326(-)